MTLYTRKIEPILRDDRPTSCNQCHLAGVDLSLFVRGTPCQTMACMTQLGLVDLAQPEESKVLSWIGRAKPQSSLITAEVIQQEHAGFLEWIEYSAACNAEACPTFTDPCGQSAGPNPTRCMSMIASAPGFVDPGDCDELTIEQVFSADVYGWRDRCSPCHFTVDTLVPQAPKWISDGSDQQTDSLLSCASGSLRTMHNVLRGGYIDLTDPTKSLLVLKPLSLEGGGVMHGGGAKFDGPNDPSYQSFLAFIQRYASCSAQNPRLLAPAPPPALPPLGPPVDTQAPHTAHGPADPTSAAVDRATAIASYCDCALHFCHDASHAKWGLTDEELLRGCRSEADKLPPNTTGAATGNFLECRAAACQQARKNPDEACLGALGDDPCR